MRFLSPAPLWVSALALASLLACSAASPAFADDPLPPAEQPAAEPAAEPPEGAPPEDAAPQPEEGQPEKAPEEATEAPAETPEQDTVRLKSGVVWHGRVVQEDDKLVVLERISRSGGIGRITFDRAEVAGVRRGGGATDRPRGGPRLIRGEWFLLRSAGRIIGTRHLELWSDRTKAGPGFRIEETVRFFAQGPHLPATWTKRTEVVDLRFFPRLVAYREVGEGGEGGSGPRRYERNISGDVVDGVWSGFAFDGGRGQRCEVHIGTGTRGRLGLREYLLRGPREVALVDARIIEPALKARIPVRAGFASVTPAAAPGSGVKGHEFHWEEDGRRLISYFGEGVETLQEEIAEGVLAVPVSPEGAEAAESQAAGSGADPESREIQLPEAGIAFTAPDPIWNWQASLGSPGNTGWRTLGRMDNRVLLSDARVEWHPLMPGDSREPAQVESWLIGRLRGACRDLQVVDARRPLSGVDGAWRVTVQGTLKQESVRTIVVVVDRPRGRVVLLLAAPAAAWEQVQPALERFVSSIHPL
jgi:hypothetical protein